MLMQQHVYVISVCNNNVEYNLRGLDIHFSALFTWETTFVTASLLSLRPNTFFSKRKAFALMGRKVFPFKVHVISFHWGGRTIMKDTPPLKAYPLVLSLYEPCHEKKEPEIYYTINYTIVKCGETFYDRRHGINTSRSEDKYILKEKPAFRNRQTHRLSHPNTRLRQTVSVFIALESHSFRMYTERKKKRRVNFIPKFHSSLKKFVKYLI